jgi:hypothetical protein
MAKFMEDGDVDEWFEQESEKISKKMYIELEKGADYDIAKVKFDKAFNALLEELPKKYVAVEEYQKRHEMLTAPARWWEAFVKKKKKEFEIWQKVSKEKRKKAAFEREYTRLFKLEKRTFKTDEGEKKNPEFERLWAKRLPQPKLESKKKPEEQAAAKEESSMSQPEEKKEE